MSPIIFFAASSSEALTQMAIELQELVGRFKV